VNVFVNTADDEETVPNVDRNQAKYSDYRLSEEEWQVAGLIHEVLQVRGDFFRFKLPSKLIQISVRNLLAYKNNSPHRQSQQFGRFSPLSKPSLINGTPLLGLAPIVFLSLFFSRYITVLFLLRAPCTIIYMFSWVRVLDDVRYKSKSGHVIPREGSPDKSRRPYRS
jgi:hypothetical protein